MRCTHVVDTTIRKLSNPETVDLVNQFHIEFKLKYATCNLNFVNLQYYVDNYDVEITQEQKPLKKKGKERET